MSWGQHLILDCYDGNKELISDKANIEAFAKKLVEVIDMIPYGEPQVIHFGSGDKKGYTLVQLIETSNITCHFSEETGNFYLDVFSCNKFTEADVLLTVSDFFKPKQIYSRKLNRGTELSELMK